MQTTRCPSALCNSLEQMRGGTGPITEVRCNSPVVTS